MPHLAFASLHSHSLAKAAAAEKAPCLYLPPAAAWRFSPGTFLSALGSNPPRFSRQIKETSMRMPLLFGGGRWIRTTEGIASRFTVCPIWPLWNSPILTCVGAGGRIRTPDLLITNVGRSINELISGAFCSFRVGDSTVYKPATSIQYIRSCSRLGHGLGQTLLLHS